MTSEFVTDCSSSVSLFQNTGLHPKTNTARLRRLLVAKRDVSVQLLSPPYTETNTLAAVSEKQINIPLGTLLCTISKKTAQALSTVASLAVRYPWTVPCFVTSEDAETIHDVSLFIPMLRDRLSILQVSPEPAEFPIASVIQAALRRRPPSPSVMAFHVASGMGAPSALSPLTEQFAQALEGNQTAAGRSVATYSRTFSRLGSLTARDWRSLARLACSLCGCPDYASVDDRSVAPLAATLVRHAHKYLGISWGTAKRHIGWEWVFERALRRSGYVNVERV